MLPSWSEPLFLECPKIPVEHNREKRGKQSVIHLVWLMSESQGPQGSCCADALDLSVWGGMRDISGTHRRCRASCGVDCCSSWQIEGRSVSHWRWSRDTVSGRPGWDAPLCYQSVVLIICNKTKIMMKSIDVSVFLTLHGRQSWGSQTLKTKPNSNWKPFFNLINFKSEIMSSKKLKWGSSC